MAVIWPLVVAAVVAGVLLWALLPEVLEQTAAASLEDGLPILTPLVAERLVAGQEPLQAWLERLTAGTDLRVTVIRGDGVVLADSARTLEQVRQMDNHRLRPEVEEAFASRTGSSVRRSDTTGLRYIYVARSGTDAAGGLFALRLAQPLRGMEALSGSILRVMALTGLAALLAAGLMLLGLDRRLFRPLGQLVDGAERLARGDYSGHLEVPESGELASVASSLNRLSDRVADQLRELRSERNRLQEILSSMIDGILVMDSQGHVRFVNDAFRDLFGIEEEVEGRSPLEITRRPEIVSLITRSRDEGEPVSVDRLSFSDGRVLAVSAAPISGEGALLVARDVTERVHLDETRRDFVANVSHEIKTPLTAIRGYAETLRDGALEEVPVARKFIDRILGQCGRLEALLSDLLPLARMEAAEEQELELEPVDLVGMIRRLAEVVRPRAAKRDIGIELDLPDVPPPLQGDPEMLEQLVSNLIENAVKYNRDGGSVRVALEVGGEALVLCVKDTGIGIPSESIPRVFERFYRVDKGRARDEGGTGLGLALVKHATRLHGGRVDLQSQLGIGSTFRVQLPLDGPGPSAN
jgi:two-component system phosphate regulon sensor histidine kinase PhoR